MSKQSKTESAARGVRRRSAFVRLIELGFDPSRVDRETMRAVRRLTATTLMLCTIGAPVVLFYQQLGEPSVAWAVAGAMVGAACVLGGVKRGLSPVLGAHLGLVLLATVLGLSNVVSGGFYQPDFAWFYILPVAAAIGVGRRGAWAWTAITLAITLGFWSLPHFGVHLAPQLAPDVFEIASLFNRVTAIVGLGLLAATFVGSEQRAMRELGRANADLRREAASVALLEHAAMAANEAETFDGALHAAMVRICGETGWPIGHVYLVSEDGWLHPTDLVHDVDPTRFAALRELTEVTSFRIGDGLPGRAAETSQPQAVLDLAAGGGRRAQTARSLGLSGGLALPVPVHGRVRAVLEFGLAERPDVDSNLLEVLAHVGSQLGRVAERALLQERLQQAQKMEAVGQLAAGIAHEINNPMSYVRSSLAHLREALDRLPDHPEARAECDELLEECVQGVERTIAIVRDVNDFSRSASPQRETVDLAAVVDGALRVAAAQAPAGVVLKSSVVGTPPLVGSANQLRQVVLNLLVNAIQAVGDRGQVRVSTKLLGDEIVLRVEDDGVGMDARTRERLFEPFFTTKPPGLGTGLGLYVSYEIVHNHGGTIHAESEPGVGTAFEVSLPYEAARTID